MVFSHSAPCGLRCLRPPTVYGKEMLLQRVHKPGTLEILFARRSNSGGFAVVECFRSSSSRTKGENASGMLG